MNRFDSSYILLPWLQADDSLLLETKPVRKKRRRSSSILDSPEEARFSVFCQKRRKSIVDEHPDFDDEQVLID